MSKIKEIQAEIDEYEALFNAAGVPDDEKKMARNEIRELEEQLYVLKNKSTATHASDRRKFSAAEKPNKGDKVFDTKKNETAVVTKVSIPKKGSSQEGEPFLIDVKYSNGVTAINMKMGDRFTWDGNSKLAKRNKPNGSLKHVDFDEWKLDLISNVLAIDTEMGLHGEEVEIFVSDNEEDFEEYFNEGLSPVEAVVKYKKDFKLKSKGEASTEPDCEELLARLRANKKKAKIRARQPKPTAGESIEKAADVAVKKIEAKEGKLSVADKKRIIASFKEIIGAVKTDKEFIKELIETLKKMV